MLQWQIVNILQWAIGLFILDMRYEVHVHRVRFFNATKKRFEMHVLKSGIGKQETTLVFYYNTLYLVCGTGMLFM